MATSPVNPFSIQVPINDPILDVPQSIGAAPSDAPVTSRDLGNLRTNIVYQRFLLDLMAMVRSIAGINVLQLGARDGGPLDRNTQAFQGAINQAVKQGGGVIIVPSGTFDIGPISIPANAPPVTFLGVGESSIIRRGAIVPDGLGLIDVSASHATFQSLVIDGNVTTPVGLAYNQDFLGTGGNDPMAVSLTKNTSVWAHGPLSDLRFIDCEFRHSGGYAVLIDCITGGIQDAQLIGCRFNNNRPNLFGLPGGPFLYGSWTGGVYVNGDGRSANPGLVLDGLLVAQCRFRRNTGNCVWSHLYGLDELHQDFRLVDNYFEDCGLDGILVGGVTGGVVSQNVFRRIGYTCIDDTSRSVPRWLANANATALDSSGLVKGVPYTNNTFLNVNGGCIDMDGHGDSVISGNVLRVSYASEPEYTEDQVAISGAAGSGSTCSGINMGNTSNTAWGSKNVNISANCFINIPNGSVRLYGARDCQVVSNDIVSPDAPAVTPVILGPESASANQRATGNVIRHNRFGYNPAAPAPCVREDNTLAVFTGADKNYVFGNVPIVGAGGNATEFQKDAASGSPVYLETVWFT